MAEQANVVQTIGDWAICEDAQGEFYYNQTTKQSYDQPPAELLQLVQGARQQTAAPTTQQYAQASPQYVQAAPQYLKAAPQYSQAAPQYVQATPQYAQASPQYVQAAPQYVQAAPQPAPQPQAEAKILQQIGDWAVCEDAQGQFYHNLTTKQNYDTPPPELVNLYQRMQAPQAPQAVTVQQQPQQVRSYQPQAYQPQAYQQQAYQQPQVYQQRPMYQQQTYSVYGQ